jgi:hypothetical protein
MPRIHILGASGSGTTTLGEALARRLGLHHADTDTFFWMPTDPPYTTRRPPDDRLALLLRQLPTAGHWVLSGSALKWATSLEPFYELIVFLQLDPGWSGYASASSDATPRVSCWEATWSPPAQSSLHGRLPTTPQDRSNAVWLRMKRGWQAKRLRCSGLTRRLPFKTSWRPFCRCFDRRGMAVRGKGPRSFYRGRSLRCITQEFLTAELAYWPIGGH